MYVKTFYWVEVSKIFHRVQLWDGELLRAEFQLNQEMSGVKVYKFYWESACYFQMRFKSHFDSHSLITCAIIYKCKHCMLLLTTQFLTLLKRCVISCMVYNKYKQNFILSLWISLWLFVKKVNCSISIFFLTKMVTWILIVIVGILIHYIYIHFSERGRLLNKIPGPYVPIPIFGNLYYFVSHLGIFSDNIPIN